MEWYYYFLIYFGIVGPVLGYKFRLYVPKCPHCGARWNHKITDMCLENQDRLLFPDEVLFDIHCDICCRRFSKNPTKMIKKWNNHNGQQ
jgi:hypothetical protein